MFCVLLDASGENGWIEARIIHFGLGVGELIFKPATLFVKESTADFRHIKNHT